LLILIAPDDKFKVSINGKREGVKPTAKAIENKRDSIILLLKKALTAKTNIIKTKLTSKIMYPNLLKLLSNSVSVILYIPLTIFQYSV
jgi:hypothetical protein